MVINKEKSKIKLLPEDKSYPMFEVFRKTFFKDVCTIPKFVGSLLILLVPSVISVFGIYYGELGDNAPILEGYYGMFLFYYLSYMLVFSLIIAGSSSPLISSEIKEGTMLILVSYPLTRKKILIAKFLAVYLFGTILIFFSLTIICVLLYLNYPFHDIIPFFFINLLNWMLALFFFECIAFTISCLMRQPRNAVIIPILIFMFLIVIYSFFLKIFLLNPEDDISLFEKYYIYLFDPIYHFGNLLFYLFKVILSFSSELNMLFATFGVTKNVSNNYVETNYVSPLVSLAYLIVVPLALLVFGYFYFKKRDIQN